jgi:hypothetical protein
MGDLERRFPHAYGVVQSHVTKKDEKRPLKIIRGVVPEEDKKQEAIDKKREAIDWENRFIKQQYIEWIDARLVLESHRRQTHERRMSERWREIYRSERMREIDLILQYFLIIIERLENYESYIASVDLDKMYDYIITFLSKIKRNERYSVNSLSPLYIIRMYVILLQDYNHHYTNTLQVLYDFIYEFSPKLRTKYKLTPRELEGKPVEDDSTCTGASCGGLFDWFRKGGTRRKIKKNKSKKRKSKKRMNRIR